MSRLTDWLDLMLAEIARKRDEREAAAAEAQRRAREAHAPPERGSAEKKRA
jgi:hypothetical protein